MRLVGPILHFRGQKEGRWRLTALIAQEGEEQPEPLTLPSAAPVTAERLATRQRHSFWRYDFSLPLRERGSFVTYGIGEQGWQVHPPPAHGSRRLAYTACSGTDEEEDGPTAASRNALWRQLGVEHTRQPFHLLIQGGDQLYADTLWQAVPELGAWRNLPWKQGNAHPFTPSMAEEAGRYYFERYCWLWSQPEIAPILAAIPSLMMWDDHDIFDGWGSWPNDRQQCPVFQGLMSVAREHFALFQLAARPDRLPASFADPQGRQFGFSCRAGGIGIIAPDLRSERSRERIMSETSWQQFEAALAGLVDCTHLLVMSSVPLVNADLSAVERVFVALPGHSDLEDDLRDQWQSFAHREEWKRMLRCLVAFAARTGARVTSVSGEIHLGALGRVEGEGAVVHELTSSGIVHAPPPPLVTTIYEWVARRPIHLGADLKTRLLKIPGLGRRYLRARNWLALDLGEDGALDATWNTEEGEAGRLSLRRNACAGKAG
jgi:hypothetical protein